MSEKKTRVYAGSFQPQFKTFIATEADFNGKGDGIYTYCLNEDTGELELCHNVYGIINPARFCQSPSGKTLFAASDTNEFLNWEAGSGGGVYMFDILDSGALKYRDSRSSCGVRAVDLCCDKSGKYILLVNEASIFCTTEFVKNESGKYRPYIRRDEGCVVLLRVGEDGFEKVCDRYVLPEGLPAHPARILLDDDNYVYIANKGGNTITTMKLDTASEKLVPLATVPVGSGPDDIALHPRLPLLYTSCEKDGKLVVYRFDEARLNIEPILHVFEEEKSNPAKIAISGAGDVLYTYDNRRNEIKVYGISQDGKPVIMQRLARTPGAKSTGVVYDLSVAASGKWLLASSMLDDKILSFPVQGDGTLGAPVENSSPTPTGLFVKGC